MNTPINQGIVAFVIWSVFSTWYYVNYIREIDEVDEIAIETVPPPTTVNDLPDTTNQAEQVAEIVETAPALAISYTTEVYFPLNGHQIVNESSLQSLSDTLTGLIKYNPLKVSITGHTCDLGKPVYNDSLGMLRAMAVKDRISGQLSTFATVELITKGQRTPKVPNTNDQNRAQNRRATITITN